MRKNWPDGVKMGVALTFDLDAETFWFSRTMDSMYSPNLMAEEPTALRWEFRESSTCLTDSSSRLRSLSLAGSSNITQRHAGNRKARS